MALTAPRPRIELATAGAFTTEQVARLIGVETRAVTSWLRGDDPLIFSEFEPVAGRRIVSFEGLIEARAIAYLLENGNPLRRLRSLMVELRRRHKERHPLARKHVLTTTGDRVFEEDGGRLVNLLNDCYASTEILKPALRGKVVFEGARALYLEPSPNVLPMVRIDPRRAFGRPVVVDNGVAVPTTMLAERAELDGPEEAADWYGVSEEAVRQAVVFEQQLDAA